MPESRRRKRKHTSPSGRQKIAAIDGAVIRIKACCSIEFVIGHPQCHAYHDERCRVPSDTSERGYLRRVEVMIKLTEKLAGHGIASVVVVDTHGSEPRLLVR